MEATRPARTRFAPSPTGYVHIGSLRTTLFEWLWARHTGGQFLLRIEDTDRKRYVEGAEDQLKASLRMVGLEWDEGPDIGGPYAPYRQSERLPIYHRYADELLAKGGLYKCWCSPERLQRVREEKQARREPPGYDRHCRFLSDADRAEREGSGEPYVLRLAVPLEGETAIDDLLRGPITFRNALQDDAIMIKSDGFPTYNYAVVVDDHEMEITHVLRGEEFIATSPQPVLLYRFFGWQQPVWVHVPQVLGSDGKKLSKRHGDTSVTEYLEKGYLPEAIVNFLALIGWGYDETTEIMTRDELIERFDLRKISKSGGVFNPEKLDKFNGIYIRMLTPVQLTERMLPWLQRDGLIGTPATPAEIERVTALVPLIQERLVVLSEGPELLRFFWEAPDAYQPELLIPKKSDAATARRSLELATEALRELPEWQAPAIEPQLRALAEELGIKVGDLFMPLRVAATGSRISPPLFETLHALGREETLARFERAHAALNEIDER